MGICRLLASGAVSYTHLDVYKRQPFNFYEGWAKKILVSRQYGKGENCIEYPPLDREAITYESEKHVHLVIRCV